MRDGRWKHGMNRTRVYRAWQNMKARCTNSNHNSWMRYGGRGITVCKEWLDSFPVFLEWAMSNGYDATLEIDRIDFNGNYCPENCRWVSQTLQSHNRSSVKRSDTVSKYVGVYFHKQRRKWVSLIQSNGRKYHLGVFVDEADAARAYDRKAREIYGNAANVNFGKD